MHSVSEGLKYVMIHTLDYGMDDQGWYEPRGNSVPECVRVKQTSDSVSKLPYKEQTEVDILPHGGVKVDNVPLHATVSPKLDPKKPKLNVTYLFEKDDFLSDDRVNLMIDMTVDSSTRMDRAQWSIEFDFEGFFVAGGLILLKRYWSVDDFTKRLIISLTGVLLHQLPLKWRFSLDLVHTGTVNSSSDTLAVGVVFQVDRLHSTLSWDAQRPRT